MDTSDKIRKILEDNNSDFSKNSELKKMQDFFKKMKEAGLIKKQFYNIEPVDTIGRKYYEDRGNYSLNQTNN
ncbi:MAG: hypothetical protein HQK88_08950 [Nitrospirae bacterium]|nr:hypothetical protein [Nitrospirota bacterium]MBF0535623.1 hypothetical protein [Nitrospirota bacterium]MBF0616929.1 hypothetical protein [Nitrospirota bacterium]